MDVRELKDKASQLFTKGKFAKAAETYEEYCVVDKKDHQARLRCGDAWAKAGKKDKAIAAYSLAAEGFAKDGFLPRAIAASKLVLEIDPAHKGVQKMLADLYAQKSGGARPASRPSGVMAAPQAPANSNQLEVSRSVAAPVSSFANRKDAISLEPEKPLAPPKPGAAKKPQVETPSPMNRADAIELPEYELPLDQPQGEATVGGLTMNKGASPTRREDAIEIEVEEETSSGPQELVETSIEIELSSSVPGPTSVEIEVPIEGVPLPHQDELPAELQVAPPLAPAPVFELEIEVPAPTKPVESGVYDLTDSVAAEPARPSAPVYDLTDSVAAEPPRPSAPVYELTEELAEPPAPAAAPDLALEVAGLAAEAEVLAAERAQKAAAEKADAEVAKLAAEKLAAEKAAAAAAAQIAAEKAAAAAAAQIAAEKAAADAAAQIAAEKAAADAAARIAAEKAAADAAARLAAEKAAADAAAKIVAEKAAAEAAPVDRDSATVVAPPSSAAPPPGLKPRKTEPAPPPPTSRIWIPTPGSQSVPQTPSLELDASEAATDLEKSLEAFARFDPDAPVAPSVAPAISPVTAASRASFTELDLDGDSLLHSVEAVAAKAPTAAPLAAMIEEAMEAPDDRPEPGALPKIPLFSDLPEDAFIALFERCPLQRFDEGQLVFEQGDKADAFYVICGGTVRVFRTDGGARREIATLEEGSFFGEMALLSEAPRSASVEAGAEDTQVLAISAEILTELSASYPAVATALKKFCRQRMLSNLMNHAAIFSPFNRNDRRELVQKFRARDVKRGEVVIKEGASSDGLYVVLSGEVEIEAAGQRIAMLKEGEVFGEMSLLTRSPASATVRAARHTSLLRLPKQDFDTLILSHPQVLEHVSVLIDERKKADLLRKGAEQMV